MKIELKKNRARGLAIVGIVLVAALVFIPWSGRAPASTPTATLTPYEIPDEIQFVHFGTMFQEVLIADDAGYTIAYDCLPFPTGILLRMNPTTNDWESSEYFYSTSYFPTDAAARLGGHEIFVAGIQILPDGNWADVIEKWTFPEIQGAHKASMNAAPTSRGGPRAPYEGSVSISEGTYKPHAHRTRDPSPQRRLLYSGQDYEHIDALEADPEGRFLLFHSFGLSNLYSLDLMAATPSIQLEFSAAENMHLGFVHTMGAYDHPTEGRFYRLSETNMQGKPGLYGFETYLLDPENDGVFNSLVTMSSQQKAQSVWSDETIWHDLENYGWDFKSYWGED